jgi:hypothetical protein
MTTTGIHRESAKIYAFPTKVRKVADRFHGTTGSVTELAPKRLPVVDYHAWYHDEAIRDADRDLKS